MMLAAGTWLALFMLLVALADGNGAGSRAGGRGGNGAGGRGGRGTGGRGGTRWRLRWHALRRVSAPMVAGPATRRAGASAATPILRESGRAIDALLERCLPGGARLAQALLSAGGVSLVLAAAAAAVPAICMAVLAMLCGAPWPVAVGLAPAVGLAVLHIGAALLATRARARFSAGFAEALAIIIRSLRAGLSVSAAIAEAARGTGPVARAFNNVGEEMQLGQRLETTLWATARRIGIADFDFFVVTVTLQQETGGNLAATLDGLAETLRTRRQLALKIKAMAAEARASALIIGSLPFVMAALIWLTSPGYLMLLFTTPLGRAMAGGGLASIAVGAVIIHQMMAIRA